MRISDWSSDVCSSDLFRVQSIPTVYAVFQGQPVADLSPARTEGQFKQMLDQLLAQLPIQSPEKSVAEQIAPLLAMGEEVLAGGEAQRALSIFSQIIDMAPGNAEAQAGQLRRSEERRVGKEGVITCSSRWSPDHKKKKQ